MSGLTNDVFFKNFVHGSIAIGRRLEGFDEKYKSTISLLRRSLFGP